MDYNIHFVGNYKINGINSYKTIEETAEFCKQQTTLAIDTETSRKYKRGTYREDVYIPGLDPYVSKICMLQIGTLKDIYVIDVRCFSPDEIRSLFVNAKTTLYVAHNAKFEARFLQLHYGIRLYSIWDTMLADMNLWNGYQISYSLEALAKRYLGSISAKDIDLFFDEENEDAIDAYIIDKSTRLGFINIEDRPFTEKQVIYGGDDIYMPLEIMDIQKQGRALRDGEWYNPTVLHDLENRFCLCLADIENKGMPFDSIEWLKVAESKKPIHATRLKKLNEYVEKNYPQFALPDLFNPVPACSIEWSSPQQVIKLFKAMGYCPKEKSKQTKKFEFTVGAKALTKLLPTAMKEMYAKDIECDIVDYNTFTLNYLLFKKTEQAITTFGVEWLKYVHPITGRIHSSFKQILNTGRISSRNPNTQNLPSDKQYRFCIVTKDEKELITSDYKSQELRILAEISGDKDMLSFFNDGHPVFKDDYHSFIATKMFSLMRNEPNLVVLKDTHPEERQAAKALNFKIAYGGSAYTLKDDFGVEERVAQEFIDSYFDAIPTLRDNFKLAKELALQLGYIVIDNYTQRIWFDSRFDEMNEAKKQVQSYYPANFQKMRETERIRCKRKLNEEHPELKELWSTYFSLKGKLERNALNYRIQGLAGGMTKMAAILMREHHIKHDTWDKFYLINLIHDETLTEAIDEQWAEEGKRIVEYCMKHAGTFFCSNVVMGADAGIDKKWYKK